MTDQNENGTTEPLPTTLETRLSAVEAELSEVRRSNAEIVQKLDLLIKMQQDMYVDLRGRFVALDNNINQIKQDIQPDSFQNRLMRMG